MTKRKHTHCKECSKPKPAVCRQHVYCSEACQQAGEKRRLRRPDVRAKQRRYQRTYNQHPAVKLRRKLRRHARQEAREKGMPLALVLEQACYEGAR